MRLTQYIKSLIAAGTLDSSKSFALLLSAATGAVAVLCVAFCLVWDVFQDGTVTTDLFKLGWLVLAIGGYVAGGGAAKAISENKRKKTDTYGKDDKL